MNEKSAGTPLLHTIAAALWSRAGMLVVFAILFAGCSVFVEDFFTWQNMKGLALAISTLGMVACTMLFCLASGDFDLSVGSVVAFGGVVAAVVMNRTGSIFIGVTAALAAGGAVGLLNGVVIAKYKINALITTLATMEIARGLGYIVCGGTPVGIQNESFFIIGSSLFIGIPTPVWITIVCFIVFGLLLSKTVFGRNTLAVGGNEEAARLAGIPVVRLKTILFTLQGLMAAFAGIVLASRMTSGQPMAMQGFELEVISACVLGGVSLTGGVGSIGATIAGVLIMGTVRNAMNLENVSTFYRYVILGSILLAAVLFDRYRQVRAQAIEE